MQSIYLERPPERYRLDLQVISDELTAARKAHVLRGGGGALESVRLWRPDAAPDPAFLWFLPPEAPTSGWAGWEGAAFVTCGPVPGLPGPSLELPAETDRSAALAELQGIFERFAAWERDLQWALQSEQPLEAVLQVSYPIFGNPLFLHDADFYVLASPVQNAGMLVWEREPRTGRDMVPMEVINEFRMDREYLESLRTLEPTVFSAALRGYRILYANLWYGERYEGRICVDELERPLRPSDRRHLAYMTEILGLCLSRQRLFWRSLGSDADRFFAQMLDGEAVDGREIQYTLRHLDWGREDTYLVLKITPGRPGTGTITPAGLFGGIESQISEGRALLFHEDIAVVVNLTAARMSAAEVHSRLAFILREGLFKMGVSAALHRFDDLAAGYRQAAVALTYGINSGSMFWSYRFEEYALRYLLDCTGREIPARLLVSEKLRQLQMYDAANRTELCRTLETYLRLERNVVQTAKELYIHRSTLFYRLERIKKLLEIDLDREEERLYLALSFRLDRQEAAENT